MMFRYLEMSLLLSLLILPSTLLLCGNVAFAQEDEVEDEPDTAQATSDEADTATEDEDAKVEDEEQASKESEEPPPKDTTKTDAEEEEEKEASLKASPDADTVILFTTNTEQQFAAGVVSKCLVSFSNNGRNDFLVDMMEASLRYPQDYSYYIQNFTAYQYSTVVKPGDQANFEYVFRPHESFGGRPFGLSINLLYKDTDGKLFRDAVFNETIQLTESEEGMDGETFFLYLFIAAIALLLVMAAHYGLTSMKVLKKPSSKAPIEMGTQQDADIDYEWLPKETTTEFASKNSPRRSPRNRRQKRNTGDE